jgi:hypothetical protein
MDFDLKTMTTAIGMYALAGVIASVYARMLADTNEDGSVSEAEYDAKMASGLFRLFSPINVFMKLVYGYVWPFPATGNEA